MIDAYTIGITLALNDGVSSGIAAIRKELMLLDGAVQCAAGAMAGMNALTDGVDWRRFGDIPAKGVARAASIPAPIAIDQSQDLETAALLPPSVAAARQTTLQAEIERPLAPTPMPAPATEIAAPPRPVDLAAVRPQTAWAPLDDQLPRKTAPDTSIPPVVAAPNSLPIPPPTPRENQTGKASPPTPREHQTGKPPASAPPAQADKLPRTARSLTPQQDGSGAPRQQSQAPTALPVPPAQRWEFLLASTIAPTDDQPGAPVQPLPPSPLNVTVTAPLSSAPIPPSAATRPPEAQSDSPDDRRSSAAPATLPDAGSLPIQADLYIDGAVLGRWVTRHLERQLVRPPSGIAAVDPRMTPVWAGPATGV